MKVKMFSTVVLYLIYLWYKCKRTFSRLQRDKKRTSSEPTELIEIDDQELLLILGESSRTLELSHNVEEEHTIGDSVLDSRIDHSEEYLQSQTIHTVETFTDNLNNLILSAEVNQVSGVEVAKEKECIKDKACWTEKIEKEDYRTCPKAVIVKKEKKKEEPKLFEKIRLKGKKKRNRKSNQLKDNIKHSSESQNNNKANTIVKASKTVKTVESLSEELNNLKLSTEVDQVREVEVAKEEECIKDKACWTEKIEKEDYRICPKAVIVKKEKKKEESKLFVEIRLKGKKKRNRKRNQSKDNIKHSSESQNNNKANTIVKASKTVKTVESLSEELIHLKLSTEMVQVREVEVAKEEKCIKDKSCWTEKIEKEDYRACPKAVIVKKVKKEVPKLFEGIKLKDKKKKNQSKDNIKQSSESQNNNKANTIVKASKTVKTVESLTEELNNLILSTEVDQVREVEVAKEEECIKDKACWTEKIEKEDYRTCPKAVIVKKVKKEEPKLFEEIKLNSKKKRYRKRNQSKDNKKHSSESQNNNKANTIVKASKTVKTVKSRAEDLNNLKLITKVDQVSEVEVAIEEECTKDKACRTEKIEKEDYRACSKAVIVKKEKKKEEGKKKRNRKRNQSKDNIKMRFQDSVTDGSSFSKDLHTVSDFDGQTIYNFLVPINLVGLLIGKEGAFVKYIKKKSNVSLFIDNKTEAKFNICTLVGSEININKALEFIRTKFPERAYPEFTLDCITSLVKGLTTIFQLFKSELIEGINNHVIIIDVITPDRFFVHNTSSMDYEFLSSFNCAMNDTYGYNKDDIPRVDLRTVSHGSVVATNINDNWYRAQVIDVDENNYEFANIFFLDYGGCNKVDQCDIRPIRDSLISFSLQAIECSLANIAPTHGEWCNESLKIFETLTTGKMLSAQVVYKSDSIQFIHLLAFDGLVTFSINNELIKSGFAIYDSTYGVFQIEPFQEMEIELPQVSA